MCDIFFNSFNFKIPTGAKIKTYHCTEVNNLVYVWHHAENIEPDWQPLAIPELDPNYGGDMWQYRGRIEQEENWAKITILGKFFCSRLQGNQTGCRTGNGGKVSNS